MNAVRNNRKRLSDRRGAPRRGSVLIVVLALLSALMLLGFLFYTIASQERENARYYSASAKWYGNALNGEDLCNFALEQIIVGPRDDRVNSVLWGGRYSLLASLVGTDLTPYNGSGVNVADHGVLMNLGNPAREDGFPVVDQNLDGSIDTGFDLNGDTIDDRLTLNLADWAADNLALTILPRLSPGDKMRSRTGTVANGIFPAPDANYSYPDLDSLYLGYIGNEPLTGLKVVIPSFHRPQYLRGYGNTIGITNDQWYTDPRLLTYSLRPHRARMIKYFNYSTGKLVETTIPRFSANFWATTGPDPISDDPAEGVWDGNALPPQYGGDPDGDGTDAAILLDLGHPVEMTSDGSQQFVPVYHISIFDLDALFNLNAHGNLYGVPNSLAGIFRSPDPTSVFVSQSNEGRHRHEVNPGMGLTAPSSSATGGEHAQFFGHAPTTWWELANMEFFFVLAGRADMSGGGTIDQLYAGRWGEANDLLKPAVLANNMSPFAYPRPGSTGIDDAPSDGLRAMRHRARRGLVFPPFLPSTLSPGSLPFYLYPGGHPADHQGAGSYVGANGRTPNRVQINGVKGQRVSTLGYVNYWFNGAFVGTGLLPKFVNAALGVPFATLYSNVGYGLRSIAGAVAGPRLVGRFVDNPGETILNVVGSRNQVTDSIFGAEETAALHMATTDYERAGFVSRLLKLVPANFKDAPNSAEIRKRFTANSRDLIAYGNAVGKRFPADIRRWEAGLNNAANGTNASVAAAFEWNVFPPYVQGETPFVLPARGRVNLNQMRNLYGFRPAARAILQQQGVMPLAGRKLARDVVKGLIRKLSVNHVAALAKQDGDDGYEYLLRPLTPHPTQGVQRDEIPAPIIVDTGGNPRTPANTGDLPGTAGVRAHFGMPDSWLVKNALTANGRGPATWNMSSFSNADLNALGIVDSGGNAWPEALQEWHARRDRQNLARDIYTLLYMFGHVNPSFNPTTDPPQGMGPTYYTDAQMREMAQFAVNVVDAMDPDDTVTLFVYDKNLSDGYTLLDSGYGTLPGGTNPAAPTFHPVTTAHPNPTWEDAERGMVFGVEKQSLAFSEVLAVLAKRYMQGGSPNNHGATQWDDTKHRDYVYVELQNMTPYDIPLDGGWSIVCIPTPTGGYSPSPAMRPYTLTILDDFNGAGQTVAEAGSVYTIGTAGDNDLAGSGPSGYAPSFMMVDPNTDASGTMPTLQLIVPAAGTLPPGGVALDFDGIRPNAGTDLNINAYTSAKPWADGGNQHEAMPATTSRGADWLYLGPVGPSMGDDRGDITAGDVEVTFLLRRRLNLHRTFPLQNSTTTDAQRTDNPWVTVDECKVPLRVFDLSGTTAATDVQSELDSEIVSTKRPEPLNRSYVQNTVDDSTPTTLANERIIGQFKTNSLGGYAAQDIGSPSQLWQRHYDRPFASIAGLLQVPLFAPWQLTETINTGAAQPAVNDPTAHALARFLFPDAEPRIVNVPTVGTQILTRGNLWYRAFAFLEVPEKYGNPDALPWFVHYGGSVPWGDLNSQQQMHTRRFGKININTMRHPQVLGGLLDDPRVMNPNELANTNQIHLPSVNGETVRIQPPLFPIDGTNNRDWWISTLASRDGGLDQLSSSIMGTRMILPGVPAAHPFKGFSIAPVPPGGGGGNASAKDIFQTFSQTMMRPLFGDQPPFPYTYTKGRRSLFALGNAGGALGSTANLATRFRLLGKVLKHGTTRSNTYVIFITCDFYEAEPQNVPGVGVVYQVGQKMPADPGDPEEPRYRGVYVVDRTLALELLQKKDLPPLQPNAVYPRGSKYRTFSFARNRNGESKFDWKKLLLYSEIVKSE